ncbi:Os03g0175500 [Oryza sativa Japonica Group]|uniref:Os03g0175500 protein n=1 Tax=Oryza sativa subsp. japonica TaxID=39947 RepID=A0A0P0VTR6_ORYSJ|nr:Os03g0175500 [Oryza sativa Japonica Group]
MDGGDLGGGADGASVNGGLAGAAQAQAAAREQRHRRLRDTAGLARRRPGHRVSGSGGGGAAWGLEAARLRVLGVALPRDGGDGTGRLEELVKRGAEADGDGLVALGNAHPRLPLRAHLAELLL